MKRSDAFPSSYLGKDDLPAPPGSFAATIADVRMETIGQGQEAEDKPVMYFSDQQKPLIVNGGNWDTCEQAFGADSAAWVDKRIEMYIDPNVMYGGRRVGGIRMRVLNGTSNGTSNGTVKEPMVTTWTVEEMKTQATRAGVELTAIRDAIAAKGGSGWNPDRDTPVAQGIIAKSNDIDLDDIPF